MRMNTSLMGCTRWHGVELWCWMNGLVLDLGFRLREMTGQAGWSPADWLLPKVCDSGSLLVFRAVTQNVSLFAVRCSLYFQLRCQLHMWNFSCSHFRCKCWKSCFGRDAVMGCDGLSYLYMWSCASFFVSSCISSWPFFGQAAFFVPGLLPRGPHSFTVPLFHCH